MSIEISAVICTHNRAGYLDRALCSLAAQTFDPQRFEVLVVDSASNDETPAVFTRFSRLPNWRYLRENSPGLSIARNVGWKNSQGKLVTFMDDDAVASPGWLAEYSRAFAAAPANIGCLGGRCLPVWEIPRPAWLSDSLLPAFSIFYYGDKPLELGPRQFLTGCNFAFPSHVLREVGGFREDLGRKGASLLGNEDIQIREQLDQLGLVSIYDPEIIVDHHIPADRLTKKWFRQRAWWQGISQARMRHPQGIPGLAERLFAILKKGLWGSLRLGLAIVTPGAAAHFRRELQVYEAAGEISALWRQVPPAKTHTQVPEIRHEHL